MVKMFGKKKQKTKQKKTVYSRKRVTRTPAQKRRLGRSTINRR